MLNDQPILGFVATTKPAAAKTFYRDTLGLRLLEDSPFALVFEVMTTQLRVQKAPHHIPAPHTVFGWRVSAITETVDALGKRGVTFDRYDGMGQDERGIWTTPDGGKVAWFKDPDGNVLSLAEFAG